jgi:carbon monoxide dehydrogenase subunit G
VKLHQEFVVAEPVATVWKFFDKPEAVADCMPGVEQVTVLDPDNVQVRATQSIGPMTATFDAKVTVLERVTGELIRFRASGRSVRGAIGNVRTENTVTLRPCPEGTNVAVDGDVVLAGALGSVGQKVVARQADKVTAEFAANLRTALSRGVETNPPDPPARDAARRSFARLGGPERPSAAGRPRGSLALAAGGAVAVGVGVGVVIFVRRRKARR